MKYHSALRVNACLLAMLVISGSVSAATQINALFMTQAAYSENDIRAMTSDFEKQHPDVKVNSNSFPTKRCTTRSSPPAARGVTATTWCCSTRSGRRSLAASICCRMCSSRIAPDEREKIFPGAMNTVVYQGKTLGMPWILDTKYLYYNKAMLDKAGIKTPPVSWQQVMDDAKVLKDKGIVKYPLVWSWSQAEALVCDYTTLVSGFGGSFYQNGKLDFSTPASLKAVTLMKTSLDQGLSNPASREYLEEDVRKAFSNGDAAFALNWTYMYNMANDPKQSKVAGDVGIVPAPGDTPDKPGAVNGSMGLGIAKASQHSEEAWQYIHYLTSQPVQDKYAKLSLPVWKASYQDPAVAKGQESLIAAADKSLNVMLSRPETADYSRLSNTLQQQLQSVLQGKATPDVALKAVDTSAARLR